MTPFEGEDHHIVSRGAAGKVDDDYNRLSLCFQHHIGEYHGYGWKTFIRMYPEVRDKVISARVKLGKKIN
jgi:hypothetical protein